MDLRAIELLVDRGLVATSDIEEAQALRKHGSGTLAGALIRLGAISEEALARGVAQACGAALLMQPPQVSQVIAAQETLQFSIAWLADHEVVLWLDADDNPHLAHAAGESQMVSEAAEQWSIPPARRHVLAHRTLRDVIAELEEGQRDLPLARDRFGKPGLQELAEDAPAIDFINAMFAEAMACGASDIHVEPFQGTMQIRLRIDGTLNLWKSVSQARFAAIASRIKLLCGMDIAERRMPQDGRQSIRIGGREIDIRVSSLPGVWGESIVMRFLGRTADLPSLQELGLDERTAGRLLQLVRQPSGLLLISGPTGSGKTTTVYKLLESLNDGSRKIITIEDPVEIDLAGVIQVNVRHDIGLEFATGLRAMLRQDPDVIFVGEIRDSETARMAVRAALTGHLVVSTVHTGSAVASVSRLLDLGIEGYLLAEAMTGVAAQRLLRKRQPDGPAHYAGRVGIFELLEITPALREAIRNAASIDELQALALESGFAPLRQDALSKVNEGLTDLEEVERVLGV